MKTIALACATVLFVCGCSVSSANRTDGVTVKDGYLVVENEFVSADLSLCGDKSGMNEFGFYHVQVTVKNETIEDFRCQYRITWLDQNGLAVTHVPTPWKDIMFHGKETKVINEVCPLASAKNYRLTVRR